MSRLFQLLLGPELYWIGVYGVTVLFARRNLPATEAGNQFIERLGWLLPLVSIPLSFWLMFGLVSTPSSRGWMIARLMLATTIGLNVSLFRLIEAIDYHDSRNSGVLGIWAIGFVVGFVLFFGGLIVMTVISWRSRTS